MRYLAVWLAVLPLLTCAKGVRKIDNETVMMSCDTPLLSDHAGIDTLANPMVPRAEHADDLRRPRQIILQLGLRDEAALDRHLAALAAGDANVRPLTPSEFRARHGRSDAEMKKVAAHLQAHGIVAVAEPHGQQLRVEGSLEQLAQALRIRLQGHKDRHGRADWTTHDALPKIAGIDVVLVDAIATTVEPVPHLQAHATVHRPFTAKGIRQAYGVPDNATGRGQKLGIVALAPYDPADVAAYAQAMGIREVPRVDVHVSTYVPRANGESDELETALDVQLANAMAPGLDEIRVYMGRNQDFLKVLHEVANPSLGDKALLTLISCSWGTPERGMSRATARAEHAIFKQMAAQGQSFFAASGDNGSHGDGINLGTDDPASQPYVIAVGGTSLYANAQGDWAKETAWSGSGGGISCYWPQLAWQQPILPDSVALRKVPDVALNADQRTGHRIVWQGKNVQVGGTSAAAPLWTAFAALIQERRNGLPPLGFLAPHFYRVAMDVQTRDSFRDIITGSNGAYSAMPGFDEPTGWGSMDGAKLLQAMQELP